MFHYEKQSDLKKKVSYESKKYSEKISINNIKLIHQIFNTINISLLVLILTLFFLSFDSQIKWSNTYKNLSKTRAINNNIESFKQFRRKHEYQILEEYWKKRKKECEKNLSKFF